MSRSLPPPILRAWLSGRLRADVTTLERCQIRRVWRRAGLLRRLLLCAACLGWPAILLLLAARQTFACGRIGKRESGKSRARQFREQMQLGLVFLVHPTRYYIFELFHEAHRARAADYVRGGMLKRGAYALLSETCLSADRAQAFADKTVFAARAAGAGLPVAPCLLHCAAGEVVSGPGGQLPASDLFVKPAGRSRGRAERWIYSGGAWRDGATSLDEPGFIAHCRERSQRNPIVVQQVVTNAAAFLPLGLGALATLQIITLPNRLGMPEAHFALLRMPGRVGAISDSFQASGLAAAIDLGTGILGPASNMGLSRRTRWHSAHPSTGAPIAGFAVPRFAAALDLALQAHRALGGKRAIGWRITLTERGALLIGADPAPDLEAIQRIQRMPLGGTRFCEMLAWHVSQADPSFGPGSGAGTR